MPCLRVVVDTPPGHTGEHAAAALYIAWKPCRSVSRPCCPHAWGLDHNTALRTPPFLFPCSHSPDHMLTSQHDNPVCSTKKNLLAARPPPPSPPPSAPPPPRPPPPLTRSYSSVLKLANMLSPGSCSAYWKARLACMFSFTLRSLYVTAGGARVRTCTTTQHTRGVSSNNSHCCQSFCCAQCVCAHWRSSVLPAATDGWRVSHQVWAVMVPGAVRHLPSPDTPPPPVARGSLNQMLSSIVCPIVA